MRNEGTRVRLLVTGASGLIGSALCASLSSQGHEVLRLVRARPRAGESAVFWDPGRGEMDGRALEGLDGAVHLAGENISAGRWTESRKESILRSRVEGTLLLSRALAACSAPPKVLLSASAVGFYGDRGGAELDEASPSGEGFLAEVCEAWERAADPARERGIRVVHPRFGIVLSGRGGALPKMLPPFKLGLGGRVGGGRQFMSWIALSDAVGVLQFLLTRGDLEGPVNAVAPYPVTNAEFSATLGRALRRPALLPLPGFAVRLALGEMGGALLLGGAKVAPAKLLEAGYAFRFPLLQGAIEAELNGPKES